MAVDLTTEAISSELSKYVKDLILLVEQSSFFEDDLIKFRLDWLFSILVRYLDYIPSGEAVLSLTRQAAVLLIADSDDVHCGKSSVLTGAEILLSGRRGRPRFFISKEKLEFLLDMKFTSGEITSMLCVSTSTVKRRIREYDTFIRQRYSDISENKLDQIVERIMREFPNRRPNSGYKRMTSTGLLQNAGYRIQQIRIRRE